jgi:lysozyme
MGDQSRIAIFLGAAMLLLFIPASASAAEAIIQKFEGLKLNAYKDAGTYSIGYGSQYNYDKGRQVISTDKITQQTALKWLKLRNDENRQLLDQYITVFVSNNQKSALLSLLYNIGSNNFLRSTLLKKLNARLPKKEIADQFDVWIKSQGVINQTLVKRRAIEKQLFLS